LKFEFSTNIPYDRYQWTVDKNILTTAIWTPQVGTHTVAINLFSGNTLIQSAKASFEVQE
jgi:hypothetical protein